MIESKQTYNPYHLNSYNAKFSNLYNIAPESTPDGNILRIQQPEIATDIFENAHHEYAHSKVKRNFVREVRKQEKKKEQIERINFTSCNKYAYKGVRQVFNRKKGNNNNKPKTLGVLGTKANMTKQSNFVALAKEQMYDFEEL